MTSGWAFVYKGHIWFVLSEPCPSSDEVLCVNLTTLDEDCEDDECILNHNHYSWISHESAIAFSRANPFKISKLYAALKAGILKRPSPDVVPPETVRLVVSKARQSRQLRKEYLKYFPSAC